MSTNRKFILANGYVYHIYNRGVEKRNIFINKRDYTRALETIKYYQYKDLPCRFSKFLELNSNTKMSIYNSIKSENKRLIDIISYALMPNHFHFILRQITDKGISTFVSKFTNSYTKYFNKKYDRVGHLLQGVFKSVLVEDDYQLPHLSRYIHINPSVAALVDIRKLQNYYFSSYPEYLELSDDNICQKDDVLKHFKNPEDYKKFVLEQVSYAKELVNIKHLTLEG